MQQHISSKLLVCESVEANIKNAEGNLEVSTQKVQDFLKEYGTDAALSDASFSAKRTNYIDKIRSYVQIHVKQKLNAEIKRLDLVARQVDTLTPENDEDVIALEELKVAVQNAKDNCKRLYEKINSELSSLALLYEKFSADAAKCEALRSNRTESNIATKVLNIAGILLVLAGLSFLCHLLFPDFWERVAPIALLAAAGTILTVSGIFAKSKTLQISGLISAGFATILFLIINGFGEFFSYLGHASVFSFGSIFSGNTVSSFQFSSAFSWTYLAITLTLVAIVGAYIAKKTPNGTSLKLLKGLTAFNLWLYLSHLVQQLQVVLFRSFFPNDYTVRSTVFGGNGSALVEHNNVGWVFVATALTLLITVGLAIGFTKVKAIASKGFYGVSIALSIIALADILGFVSFASRHPNVAVSVAIYALIAAAALIATCNLFVRPSFEAVRSHKRTMIIFFSSFLILYLTIAVTAQFRLSFTSYFITGGYVAIAVGLIVFGLLKNYAAIRRFALGLTFVATLKLLLIDFHGLDEIPRVVATISTGLAFIAISFIYKAFAKKLMDVNYATSDMEEICSESTPTE